MKPPDVFADVKDFHRKHELPSGRDDGTIGRRLYRIRSEVDELGEEFLSPCRLDHLAHETIDIIYCAVGLFVELGIDFNEAWRRIHKANMAKEGKKAQGGMIVVTKPPGWTPAVLRDLVPDQPKGETRAEAE